MSPSERAVHADLLKCRNGDRARIDESIREDTTACI